MGSEKHAKRSFGFLSADTEASKSQRARQVGVNSGVLNLGRGEAKGSQAQNHTFAQCMVHGFGATLGPYCLIVGASGAVVGVFGRITSLANAAETTITFHVFGKVRDSTKHGPT